MYKVMLADDEGIVIDSLKFIILKEFGDTCIIESAKTGRSVIELAEHFRPDIVFMDIQMPGINGIEAMKEIREGNKNTIFIVISAYDKFDYAKEAISLGVLEYLNKPIERNNIIRVLKKAMQLIDTEREKRSNDLIAKEKLESVIPIIENGFIYNALFQENFEEDIDNYRNLLGIDKKYGFIIVLVCGESQEGNHMTNAVGTSVRIQNYYHEIRELVSEYYHGVIMGSVMANKIALFVPSDNDKMEYAERIQIINKSRELCRKLQFRTEAAFRIGIGSIQTIMEAMVSYNEALNALVDTTGSVAHVDDVGIGCEYEENYPVDLEKRLFEYIEKGDINDVVMTANHFFDWMEENYADCMMDIKLKALEFVLWAEHLAYDKGGYVYQFRSRKDYLPSLLAYNQLSEVRFWFVNKISDASRKIAAKKEGKTSHGIIDRAKEFIVHNYKREISLDDVSRDVNISPYYFSKVFKDETGENFIEYLTNLRVNKAKELLQDSDKSMKEIGYEVGYTDPNYFSRIFKKTVGVTPTEFKGENK